MSDNNRNQDRFRRAKSEVTHSRSTVGSLRNEFRNRFFNRLRSSRSKSVDTLRQIVEDYGDDVHYKSVEDLRRVLLRDKEASSLLMSDEVNAILNEIEKELAQVDLQKEAEQYMKENELETQDILNRHLKVCSVCDKLNEKGNVCAGCSTIFQSDFN